jgi:hypothetical protein
LLAAFFATGFGGAFAIALRAFAGAAPFLGAAPEDFDTEEDLDFGAVFFFEAALAMAFNGPQEGIRIGRFRPRFGGSKQAGGT